MKIVFLDLDGVLVTRKSLGRPLVYLKPDLTGLFRGDHEPKPEDKIRAFCQLDPACVDRLNRLTSTTGAKIVISSSWRHGPPDRFKELIRYLEVCGVEAEVIDRTPGTGGLRGDEIKAWLLGHPEVTDFVILDDDDDMGNLADRLVRTGFDLGLEDHHVDTAAKILAGQSFIVTTFCRGTNDYWGFQEDT